MKKPLVLALCVILLLAPTTMAVLAASYHRVVVVESISGAPISGAFVVLQRSSSSSDEVGHTDANGRLVFWTTPLPLPRLICAQATFYPQACVNAISLLPHLIELPVPTGSP